ncbi:MAG: penicillin-binding protein activator [Alphaproteobacteria bacterium]|nr:penicillin-binding protein activator [Alphaproteobacteria bacterium]
MRCSKPEQQTSARPPAPAPYSGQTGSRLQSQPWPPGMGQPLPQGGTPSAGIPQPPPAAPAPARLPQAQSGKIQVALLLPLSGKNAALGQAMLNAAQLAVFDLAPSHFELMPRDTGASSESAALAAHDAISSGAQLLIGPLFAADVAAIKPIVQTSNINMLALSTDVSLAEPGAYVMGFAPTPQVERVVAYAAHQGAQRFAAVIPSGPYGALVKQAFETSVHQQGGSLVAMESPARLQTILAQKDQIDALLLPLGGHELRLAVSQLASAGLDPTKVHLLGTGLWDEAGLGRNLDLLVGGWYATAEPDSRETFIKTYAKTYGQEPPRLATLAYDATALAAVLAARGGRYDRAALTSPNGFSGLDGIFRLTPQGVAERGLAISEITPAGSKIIDPSPSTFLNSQR